ncbi:MAG: hypothetical protein LUD50_06775 [Clostridia bacterium]|nr:hypothetical protein [Clostridia bacterium]
MDRKGKRIIGGVTLGVYVLLLADFVVSICRAFADGTEDGGIMASYVFVPFVIFVVFSAVQAVLFFGPFKITPVVHDIIALAKAIIVLLCTLLFGFTVLRASWYSIDGITAWGSLSCPVYATILVSVYIALTFICAACEIVYIMRVNMEQNIARRQAWVAGAAEMDIQDPNAPSADEGQPEDGNANTSGDEDPSDADKK